MGEMASCPTGLFFVLPSHVTLVSHSFLSGVCRCVKSVSPGGLWSRAGLDKLSGLDCI